MKSKTKIVRGGGIPVGVVVALLLSLVMVTGAVHAEKSAPGKRQGPVSLPSDLFVSAAPADPLEVGHARKASEEGKPIVIRGRIGGMVEPFAAKYAIFVLSDLQLPPCTDGCPTAWDYCCTPRETIMANVATIQVVDADGRPLKVPVKGVNGLKAMSEVIVSGTVAKRNENFLVVNARNIFVSGETK